MKRFICILLLVVSVVLLLASCETEKKETVTEGPTISKDDYKKSFNLIYYDNFKISFVEEEKNLKSAGCVLYKDGVMKTTVTTDENDLSSNKVTDENFVVSDIGDIWSAKWLVAFHQVISKEPDLGYSKLKYNEDAGAYVGSFTINGCATTVTIYFNEGKIEKILFSGVKADKSTFDCTYRFLPYTEE